MLSKTPVLAKVVLPKERPILIFSLRELAKLVLRKLYVPIKVWVSFRQSIILLVTSNNQSCFPQFFPQIYPQFEQLKKKTNFSLVPNWEKTCFGPIKSLISFSNTKTEKKIVENKIGCLMSRTKCWFLLRIHQTVLPISNSDSTSSL